MEDQLGGAALAAVYRARDTVLNRFVALKVLFVGADATTRERFQLEARTAAMLEHPNVVRTYEVGQDEDSGLSYIGMELIQGPSLAALLERENLLSATDTARLLEPIARALAYAHERGVVHRDVKPSNILLREVDAEHPLGVTIAASETPLVPLLSDFGIARALDAPDLTSDGRTIGTPAYMSPEQCSGAEELDGRADLYSLGAVLYRCLVGRPPYAGTTTQILYAHVYEPLTIPDAVAERVPPGAIEVVRKSMAKSPAERYDNGLQMAQELAAVAAGAAAVASASADDETAEMPASAAPANRPVKKTTNVLIPVRGRTGTGTQRAVTDPSIAQAARPKATTSGRRSRTGRWPGAAMVGLSIALVVLLAMLGVTYYSGVLPALSTGDLSTATPIMAADSDDPAPVAGASQAGASGDGAGPGQVAATQAPGSASVTPATPGPGAVATSEPPPLQVSPEFALKNARDLFDEQDWGEAREWLIAVQRADPEFEPETVAELLAATYVGLAAHAIEAAEYSDAHQWLVDAADAAGGAAPYAELEQAAGALADSTPALKPAALRAVQQALVAYAAFAAGGGRYCDAQDLVDVAQVLDLDEELQPVREQYEAECEPVGRGAALAGPSGRILFSAVAGDVYGIYDVAVEGATPPQVMAGDASQPALSPDGRTLAFYSRRPDIEGLTSSDVRAGSAVADERVRLTSFVEDARDSAPSWNPQGDRLAYGSTNFGDGHSRIYLTWADGTRNTVELGLGKDPAWHPNEDLVVFNGSDETGNNPGLWLMRTDGTHRIRLTENGDDQRPAWLPDGSGVVFMSSGRDGNWEVYLVRTESGEIVRLTDNFAQDGLPAVSPDGRYVAFMSDRDGYWALWYVPVGGGDAKPLADIEHELPKWLEHSIQWLR